MEKFREFMLLDTCGKAFSVVLQHVHQLHLNNYGMLTTIIQHHFQTLLLSEDGADHTLNNIREIQLYVELEWTKTSIDHKYLNKIEFKADLLNFIFEFE